jgi:hypothetical protein
MNQALEMVVLRSTWLRHCLFTPLVITGRLSLVRLLRCHVLLVN